QDAADLNKGMKENVSYPRQVSRAIAVIPKLGAFTGGKDGYLYRFDFGTGKLEQTTFRLPSVAGREPWASLDAAVVLHRADEDWEILGGTSDGYLFELRPGEEAPIELRPRGRALGQGTIHAMGTIPTPRPYGGAKGPGTT